MARSPLETGRKQKGLSTLSGSRRKRKAEDAIGSIEKITTVFDMVDNELAVIEQALGDTKLAKRVLKIKREKYPNATLPELVCIDWLVRRNIEHMFQVGLFGGRLYKGGIVPDLIVYLGNSAIVWPVQGNYWHQRPGMEQRDLAARRLLMGLNVYGHTITAVVEVWERRILEDADKVCASALMGIEEGP